MSGKTVENNKFLQGIEPDARTGTMALYNGVAATAQTGVAIDTLGYDNAVFILNSGAVEAGETLAAAIYESATDATLASTAIDDADFTDVTSAADEAVQIGAVKCSAAKRYLNIRTIQTLGSEANYSATVILGKSDLCPVSQTVVFDV